MSRPIKESIVEIKYETRRIGKYHNRFKYKGHSHITFYVQLTKAVAQALFYLKLHSFSNESHPLRSRSHYVNCTLEVMILPSPFHLFSLTLALPRAHDVFIDTDIREEFQPQIS